MKKVSLAFGIALLLVTVGACALVMNLHYGAVNRYEADPALAVLDGKISAPGLSGEVNIYRDQWGVPHIFSDNDYDLFFAVGYVQAQDRLWEMVLLRALSEGRMAELMGDVGAPGVEMMGFPLSTVGIDRRQRTMGMKYMGEVAAALMKETDPRLFRQNQAYCDGVNFYLDSLKDLDDLPLEFQILQTRPGRWTVADTMSIGRFVGSLLAANLPAELGRYAAIKKYGPDKGWELFPIHYPLGPTIVPTEMLHNRLDQPRDIPPGGRPSDQELGLSPQLSAGEATRMLQTELGLRSLIRADSSLGSNNWIVSGKFTASGKPMLANDPHLQHIQPSLFYMMHVKGAGYDAFGVTFPGNPYLALGHTRKLAWGSTTSRADVQDLFVETVDPARPGGYLYRGEWKPFTVRRELIKVRVGSRLVEREFEVRQSIHGPIINDDMKGLPPGSPPVALRWTGWDLSRDTRAFELAVQSVSAEEFMNKYRSLTEKFEPASIMRSLERLMRAEKVDDFIAAMEWVDLPNQNWVATDADGRIAYITGGLVPIRGRGLGALPAPGESGEYDWTGFIPLAETPQAIDPERGWMATANNQVVDPRDYPYIFSTHYAEPWRAMRIEEMIEEQIKSGKKFTVDDFKRIQNDVLVRRAMWEMTHLRAAIERKRPTDKLVLAAYGQLADWNFQADQDNTAAVIFFEFHQSLFRNVMADEVSKTELAALRVEGYPEMLVDICLDRGDCEFADDHRTAKIEDLDDMIVKSLADAMKRVEKKWGDEPSDWRWWQIHMIKWYHPLGIGPGKVMSVGPFPHLGADHTVRNARAAYFGRWPYKTMTGPCFKHIIDMGAPDEALMIIDGSESGQWLSPHYDDLHPLFVEGSYIIADKDPERIKKGAQHHLILAP